VAIIPSLYDLSIKAIPGLITFATRPSIKQPISGAVEDLRNALRAVECGGDTAMWDALNLASECIQTYSAQFPEAKKRIVCLSDGVDTNSTAQSWLLCKRFQVIIILHEAVALVNGWLVTKLG